MVLDPDELAGMRTASDELLPDTCTIQRSTTSSDSMGGTIDSWAAFATDIPCRVSPEPLLSAGERTPGDRLAGVQRWIITFAYTQDVRITDRILYGIRTFEVEAVDGSRSWEIARRVHCVEVT